MTFWLGALIVGLGFVCCMACFTYALCAVAKDVDDMIERRNTVYMREGDDASLAHWAVEAARRDHVGGRG